MELLGGEITLDSEIDLGSAFTVLLPDEKANGDVAQAEGLNPTKTNARLTEATALEFADFYMS